MRQTRLLGLGLLVPLAGAFYLDGRAMDAARQSTMSRIDPTSVALTPAPIPTDWIIAGHPDTRAAEIAHTDDGSTKVFVWQTTRGAFHWYYTSDEIVQVMDGEVFVADRDGPERRLGAGDVAFFPAGASTTWRVPDHVRKVATLKRPLLGPIASLMRWGRAAKSWLKPQTAFAG